MAAVEFVDGVEYPYGRASAVYIAQVPHTATEGYCACCEPCGYRSKPFPFESGARGAGRQHATGVAHRRALATSGRGQP